MKDNTKITLSYGQLKRLIKESSLEKEIDAYNKFHQNINKNIEEYEEFHQNKNEYSISTNINLKRANLKINEITNNNLSDVIEMLIKHLKKDTGEDYDFVQSYFYATDNYIRTELYFLFKEDNRYYYYVYYWHKGDKDWSCERVYRDF